MTAAADSGTATTLIFGATQWLLRELSFDSFNVTEINKTHMASASQEYMAGTLPEYGTVSATILWDPSTDEVPPVGTTDTLQIHTHDPGTAAGIDNFTGEAFCQSADMGVPLDDVMTMNLVFRWTGVFAYTSASVAG